MTAVLERQPNITEQPGSDALEHEGRIDRHPVDEPLRRSLDEDTEGDDTDD